MLTAWHRELFQKHLGPSETISSCSYLEKRYRFLLSTDAKVSDMNLCLHFQCSLNETWEPYIQALRAHFTPSESTYTAFKNALLLEEQRRIPIKQNLESTPTQVSQTLKNPQITCSNCNKNGHDITKCFRPGGGDVDGYKRFRKEKANTSTTTTHPDQSNKFIFSTSTVTNAFEKKRQTLQPPPHILINPISSSSRPQLLFRITTAFLRHCLSSAINTLISGSSIQAPVITSLLTSPYFLTSNLFHHLSLFLLLTDKLNMLNNPATSP
jgi:hypothetical protein